MTGGKRASLAQHATNKGRNLLHVVALGLVLEQRLIDALARFVIPNLLYDFLLGAHVLGQVLEDDVSFVFLEVLVKELAALEQLLRGQPLVVLVVPLFVTLTLTLSLSPSTPLSRQGKQSPYIKKMNE